MVRDTTSLIAFKTSTQHRSIFCAESMSSELARADLHAVMNATMAVLSRLVSSSEEK